MDLDQLIEALTKLREEHGGDKRVLWWDWEPDFEGEINVNACSNVELAQFHAETGDILLC